MSAPHTESGVVHLRLQPSDPFAAELVVDLDAFADVEALVEHLVHTVLGQLMEWFQTVPAVLVLTLPDGTVTPVSTLVDRADVRRRTASEGGVLAELQAFVEFTRLGGDR